MSHTEDDKKPLQRANEDKSRQPDPETLGTTDPQEHMKGPISSLVQKTKETVEEKGAETPVQKKED